MYGIKIYGTKVFVAVLGGLNTMLILVAIALTVA